MLGEFYLFKSDTERALREFEQEQEINPANFSVYDRLGDVYTRSGSSSCSGVYTRCVLRSTARL